jgi:hypothetical protein
LNNVARQYNAQPVFQPEFQWSGGLLYVQEDRDALWVQLDGRSALEHLCRCSAIQFTVDVNPNDAIPILNALNASCRIGAGYAANDRLWQRYMAESNAHYLPLRYGGPTNFSSLADYAQKLALHNVVMHQGKPVRLAPQDVPDLNVDLYLRSIWWHYRLRRYGNSLCIELRPFPRQQDENIPGVWKYVEAVINGVLYPPAPSLTTKQYERYCGH